MTPTPLTTEDKLAAVQEKIVAANPEGNWRDCECDRCSICMGKYNRRAIRLADTILAIHVKTGYDKRGFHESDGPEWSIAIDDLVNCHWNLREDSLRQQDAETINALFSLLSE